MTCALYRHFDADGALLYVGITDNPSRRLAEHIKADNWKIAEVKVEWFDSRACALQAECAAIRVEQPRHNVGAGNKAHAAPPSGWRGRLSDAIAESRLSMRGTSKLANLGPGYVHSILIEGKEPTLSKFLAVCAAIDADPADIINGATP